MKCFCTLLSTLLPTSQPPVFFLHKSSCAKATERSTLPYLKASAWWLHKMLAKRNQPRDAVSIWATGVQHCYFSTPKARYPQTEIHGRKQKEKSLLLVKSNEKNVQIKLLHVASVLLLQIPSLHLSADQVLIEGFMRLKE